MCHRVQLRSYHASDHFFAFYEQSINDICLIKIIHQANYIVNLKMQTHIDERDVDINNQFERRKDDIQSYKV
jgi:hypothetical protein